MILETILLTLLSLVATQHLQTSFRSVLPTFPSTNSNNQVLFSVINSEPGFYNQLTYQNSDPTGSRLVSLPVSQRSSGPFTNFYQLFGISGESDSIVELSKLKRKMDGSYNNLKHPRWGAAQIPLLRKCPAIYLDHKQTPMPSLYSPRQVSNAIGRQTDAIETSRLNLTMAFTIWGQFLDHDISLTHVNDDQTMSIKIPECDPYLDRECTGQETIPFKRSLFEFQEHNGDKVGVREQINSITAWLDASQVYGSSQEEANRLRTFQLGRMKEDANHMLPLAKNDPHHSRDAGDIRANENLMLLTYHTIMVREHNRLCKIIVGKNPRLTDEEIYQAAKNYVAALIQKITFRDFLPKLIGQQKIDQIIGTYKGYDAEVQPDVWTEFSTAVYRIGHSLLVSNYPLIDRYGEVKEILSLNEMFFRPDYLNNTVMEMLVRGMAKTHLKQKNQQIIDEIRNLLIDGPHDRHTLLDLYALNLQRAKDHGVDAYNQIRQAYGLKPLSTFDQVTSNQARADKLKSVYGNPNNCDTWVCVLAEDPNPGAVMGELGSTVVAMQFKKLRDGDRFWYENLFPLTVRAEIDSTMWSDVVMRNVGVDGLQRDLFVWNQWSA